MDRSKMILAKWCTLHLKPERDRTTICLPFFCGCSSKGSGENAVSPPAEEYHLRPVVPKHACTALTCRNRFTNRSTADDSASRRADRQSLTCFTKAVSSGVEYRRTFWVELAIVYNAGRSILLARAAGTCGSVITAHAATGMARR